MLLLCTEYEARSSGNSLAVDDDDANIDDVEDNVLSEEELNRAVLDEAVLKNAEVCTSPSHCEYQ